MGFKTESFVGLWVDPLKRSETNNKLKLAPETSPTVRYDGSGAVLKVRFRNRRDKPTLRNQVFKTSRRTLLLYK